MTISELIPVFHLTQKIELCDTIGYIYSGTFYTLLSDGYDDWEIYYMTTCSDCTLSIQLACPFSNVELWQKGIKGSLLE
jgi:hypothetical protein